MAHPNDHHGSKDKVSGDHDRGRDPARKTAEPGQQKQHSQTGGDQRQQGASGGMHNDPKKTPDAGHKGGQR